VQILRRKRGAMAHVRVGSKPEIVVTSYHFRFAPRERTLVRVLGRSAKGHEQTSLALA
jgi:hypothetical protein